MHIFNLFFGALVKDELLYYQRLKISTFWAILHDYMNFSLNIHYYMHYLMMHLLLYLITLNLNIIFGH